MLGRVGMPRPLLTTPLVKGVAWSPVGGGGGGDMRLGGGTCGNEMRWAGAGRDERGEAEEGTEDRRDRDAKPSTAWDIPCAPKRGTVLLFCNHFFSSLKHVPKYFS